MNEARPLSHYLRLPYRFGGGLTPLDATTSGDAWLNSALSDDITHTVARVLRDGVEALRDALPDATRHIVYLRGSPVFDRITLIAPVWEQAIDLLDLAPVIEELRRTWGDERVDVALAGARRKMAHDLLGLESKSGIAKPLYRLRSPDDALYDQANLPAVLALIEALPRLLTAADEDVREIVQATTVLKMRPGTEGHFRRAVTGLVGEGPAARRVASRLGGALPVLAADLNPLLPLTTDAIARVQSAFALPDAGAAGEMLSVLRFATLTLPLLRPKTTSDVAFRLLTVVPGDQDLAAVQAAVLDVTSALDGHEELSQLRAAHPRLEVSLRPYVLQAPASDASAAQWLELAARYRTNAGSLPDAASMTLASVRARADPRWSRLEPADQRPNAVVQLRKAVEAPSDATLEALGETLFESTSVDIASKVRGVSWP